MNPDDLAGTREIATALGVSRGLVAVWQGRHADFPKPVAHLASGRIYLLPEVLAWHAARQSCAACNARPNETCSPDCIGLAASKES